MADDQVKYSELIKNDNNNFQPLIDALENVKSKLSELKGEASNLSSTLRGVGTATREQQRAANEDATAADNLHKRVKDLSDEEARLRAAIAEANRMQKLQAQAANATTGSLNEMRARYKLLVAEMGNYNLKSEAGRKKMQTATAEARRLRDEIYKLEAAYGQFGRNVGNYTGALQRFGGRLKEAAARFVAFNAAFLSFTGVVRFGKALYETRKELESSLVTFKALAGEVQGAKLFEQIKEFAFTTPVTLGAATKATQTMLSFGVSQEKVIDVMKRLGDISAGDSERLYRLSLVYSQATQAGRLMGQDTLQFINAGFNPLYYISLRTGKSMMELREEMQKGRIPIEMVTQAIVDATSEGGQFNGMLEKQKDTLKGAANIMSGAWQNMLNEMGQGMEGGMVGIIKWLTRLMENWRNTFRTIRQIAVSLSVAKAAMMLYRVAVDTTTASVAEETVAEVANAAATETVTKSKLSLASVGKSLTGVIKGLGSAFKGMLPFAVIAGVTMLIQKIFEVANASKRAAQEVRDFENNAAEGVSGTISQYQQLGREWKRLGTDQSERAKWIKEHKRLFDELGVSINNVNEADRAFSAEGTEEYIRAIRRRAIAEAYKDKLAQAAVREQEAKDRYDAILASGNAYRHVKERTIYHSNGSYTTIPAHDEVTKEYFDAQKEYYRLAQESYALGQKVAELEEGAANELASKGFTPVKTGGTESGGTGKTVKDKIKDLLALQRALEDAQTQNIEDEYQRLERAEVLRHQRFVEDKQAELELLKAEDPRRAVINQQIEEERETHDRKMLEIDEKYRQELIKRRKEEAEEAEKSAKESAKSQYEALENAWQEKRAKLVERGARKKELIEAEIAAEVNRLNTMLAVQPILNGEVMTEEEKAKIEEWIKLLNQLSASGAFGGVKSGSIYGKGAANVNTQKAHTYSNVIDVLTVNKYGENRGFMSGLFGKMDTEEISRWKSGVTQAINQAKEALQSWMDAKKEAADESRRLADEAVSTAQTELDREIELRNQGYANDVALKERELREAKEHQQAAIEQQRKVKEQQLNIDAATQSSSIITASANILASVSKMGVAGIAVGAAAIASMIGTFIWSQAQARSAVRSSTQFREGGVMLLEGGSHQSGHDVNLGIGPDGSNLRAEGGEYFAVINKRNSSKYGGEIPSVINAFNSGVFEERYMKTRDAMGMVPGVVATEGGVVDMSNVENGVSALVRQGETRYSVEGAYRVMRYKNLTRRVRV